MSKSKNIIRIDGKDSTGNKSYLTVRREENKIVIFSPEDAGDVVFSVKEAKELIKALENAIKQNSIM